MGSSLATDGTATQAVSMTSALSGLLQAVVALVVIAALSYWALRLLQKRGFGPLKAGFAQVEGRAALDGQSGLLIVRVEGRRLLLATHPQAPARLLLELDAAPEASRPSSPPPGPASP